VEELKSSIGARIGLLDLFDGRLGLALRATGYVDGAVVLVEDLAQFLADAWEVSVSLICAGEMSILPA
jgi:hypothetical protein